MLVKAQTHIQVIRMGLDQWNVHRLEDSGDGVYIYEVIGRVVLDGDLYYTELPEWRKEGHGWHRQPRGYTIVRAAYRAISERQQRVS